MKALVAVIAAILCLGAGMVITWGMVRYWAAEERRNDEE